MESVKVGFPRGSASPEMHVALQPLQPRPIQTEPSWPPNDSVRARNLLRCALCHGGR